MRQKTLSFVLSLCAIVLTFVALEGILLGGETYFGWNYFNLLRQRTAENFYYYHLASPVLRTPEHFDRLLGWRNFKNLDTASKRETLNSEKWRSQHEYLTIKTKPRVALVGDSFAYGWKVDDSETMAHHLENLLDSKYEVMNFAVRGYGLDQMAIVATRILPKYQPDIVILAFIGSDLERSCTHFQFNAKRPYFVREGTSLKLKGIPVKSPDENYREHQTLRQSTLDTIMTWAGRSRLISLFGQLILMPAQRHCLAKLNPSILRHVEETLKENTSFLVTHLDGKLPIPFDSLVKEISSPSLSVPPLIESLSAQLKLKPLRHEDGHPKGTLNRIYAQAIYQKFESLGWLL